MCYARFHLMKIACIGGGPAGLYFSILLKKAFPEVDVTVTEKNKSDDTFGWGVVFSRETLGNLRAADEPSYLEIERRFAYWDDIQTFYRGTCVTSTGHGFCGLSRRQLLTLLQARAAELGVKLEFSRELPASPLPQADLVVACDGVHSPVREQLAAELKPSVDWRKCKFSWLGTTLPLTAFTFIFKETPYGLFQVHAYPFEKNLSTFIVEAREEVWKQAGLDTKSEAESVAFLEALFAEDLKGHRLLANKSIWRTFPTVRCEKWVHGNTVLLGDAAHTAHFSIGSGTKLAMEDAIELCAAFVKHGLIDVPRALAAYEAARHPEVDRIQHAAQPSLEWFENSARYMGQPPEQLTFNLMTRSKRITWENLKLRDPKLVARVDALIAEQNGSPKNSDGSPPPPLFAPMKLKGLRLENRVVVSPMCQYSAKDGVVDDWHLVHLGSRAMGGAGLVFTEMTDVSPEGRITYGCAGMWNDEQGAAWMRIVKFVHGRSQARIGMQLAHAGRKASCHLPWEKNGTSLKNDEGAWQTFAPSAIPYVQGSHVPKAMDEGDMKKVRRDFGAAAVRAAAAGFDLLELHMAHGYLLSEFLSPLTNQRTDAYGGSLENRLKFPLEVFDVVRRAWPQDRPLGARISAHDWMGEQGLTTEDAVEISRALKAHGADFIDVSSGGNVVEQKPQYGRMFQLPFAEAVRHGAQLPVMTVGMIAGADHANTIVAAGRADLVSMARGHLSDPYLTHRHAQAEGVDGIAWPAPYALVKPQRPKR
ncbi:MAG: FAD-dependent monooxygenase [Archangiaceae bacterium]|nr:FAD-dependent monooxygenase [Archangiaceae bacterium]